MLKKKSIDYIFGMITGASLMIAFWARRSRTIFEVIGIKRIKIKINRSPNPILVTVSALWTLDSDFFRR